jgi:hypothetical protein
MVRRVLLVRTDISDEHIASVIRVTRTGELGAKLEVTSNRSTHGATSQKTAFFIVTVVETSNLT